MGIREGMGSAYTSPEKFGSHLDPSPLSSVPTITSRKLSFRNYHFLILLEAELSQQKVDIYTRTQSK